MLDKYDLTKTVVMSNDMLASRYYTQPELELTINQKKLLLLLISRIDENDTELRSEAIAISDYCELFGIGWKGGTNKRALRSSILSLGQKCFILPIKPGQEQLFRWIGDAKVNYNTGMMYIKLDDSLKPYYLGLKRNYTIFQLGYTANFTTKYSFTIYEYLKSKASMKKCYISASEAKLQFAYNKYANFADFKRFVLDPAIREINKKTDLDVRYELVKKGVAYQNIIFFVSRKTGERLAQVDNWKLQKANRKQELHEFMCMCALGEGIDEAVMQDEESVDEYSEIVVDTMGGASDESES